ISLHTAVASASTHMRQLLTAPPDQAPCSTLVSSLFARGGHWPPLRHGRVGRNSRLSPLMSGGQSAPFGKVFRSKQALSPVYERRPLAASQAHGMRAVRCCVCDPRGGQWPPCPISCRLTDLQPLPQPPATGHQLPPHTTPARLRASGSRP